MKVLKPFANGSSKQINDISKAFLRNSEISVSKLGLLFYILYVIYKSAKTIC
jgi:hypothetical protein